MLGPERGVWNIPSMLQEGTTPALSVAYFIPHEVVLSTFKSSTIVG